MKNYSYGISCGLLIIVLAITMIYVQGDEPRPWAGSSRPTKDLIIDASDVVIGKFIGLIRGGRASMEGIRYHGIIIIIETLKGKLTGKQVINLSIIGGPVDTEVEPNLNVKYVMILRDHAELVKLLPATDTSIAEVKALIAASPPSK